MKYLKIYEIFNSVFDFNLITKEPNYWCYSFKTEKYEYLVEFKYQMHLNTWEASHKTSLELSLPYYFLTEDLTLKITNTLITILKEFLQESKVDMLHISYIPTKEDVSKISNLKNYIDVKYNPINKRARIQKPLIEKIEGFKSKYYFHISGSYLIKTICLVYKIGSNISKFEDDMYKYGFDEVQNEKFKYFEAYKDFIGKGCVHKVYEIDDDWVLKMPKTIKEINADEDEDYSKIDTLKRFKEDIITMKENPDIFPKVKLLSKNKAAVERCDTKLAQEQLKYFYSKIDFTIIPYIKYNYFFNELIYATHRSREILNYIKYNLLNDPICKKFYDLIMLIRDKLVDVDGHNGNIGVDKNGNIKLIDF